MLREVIENGITYMSSDLLGVKNVFTTRWGGVSGGEFATLNLGSNRGDNIDDVAENYRRVCDLFGKGKDDACVTKQVHGNCVRPVTSADKHKCVSSVPYEADGIVTGEKGLLLFCFTADCVPVLLSDYDGKAVAAVHCGWRSSVADILGNAVAEMEKLGARRQNICAAMGPGIGKCCFECDVEVADAIHDYIGENDCCEKRGEKYYIDLREANRIRLVQLGIPAENIDVSDECTVCSHDKYWSHRYTAKHGLQRGNLAAGIML